MTTNILVLPTLQYEIALGRNERRFKVKKQLPRQTTFLSNFKRSKKTWTNQHTSHFYRPSVEIAMDDMEDIDLGNVATKEVLGLLECPVCLDHITPPVKQCVKGHLVCIDCFPRLHHCPTCRSAMCDERNLAMEQVSRLLKYPCR